MRLRGTGGLVAWVAAIGVLAGCSPQHSSTTTASPTPSAQSPVSTRQISPPTTARSTVLTTPRPTLRLASTAAEAAGTCPYISGADFASYEGDKVGRVVVLHSTPLGCRFYFAYIPATIVGEVYVNQFASAVAANNALAIAVGKHPERQADPAIGQGSEAYKTDLQGTATWQCSFLRGNRVYTVRTRQEAPAQDAFNLAKVIARNIG